MAWALKGVGTGFFQPGRGIVGNFGGAGPGRVGQFIGEGNTQGQLDQLSNSLGSFFNEQLLPGIDQRGLSSIGTLGRGRNQLARQQGAGQVADAFSQGATDIISRDIARRQQAAFLSDQNRRQGTQIGLQGLSGLQGIGLAGVQGAFAPLLNLAALIGSPTVLQEQSSRSRERGFNIGLFG